MNILFAHAGHEHATGVNPVTHHLPSLIALTVIALGIAAIGYWAITRRNAAPEETHEE